MTWIRRGEKVHVCKLPYEGEWADGIPGDVWRCDRCRQFWEISGSGRWRTLSDREGLRIEREERHR